MPNTGKSMRPNGKLQALGDPHQVPTDAPTAVADAADLLEGEQAFHKTARAGPLPGVATQVGGFKVCDEPQVYVLDTPGVLPPAIRDPRVAERLALTGLIPAAGPGGMEEGALLRRLLQVCDEPQVYVLDTPGVLPPAIRDPRVAERLALTGLIPAAGPGGMEEGALLRRLLQRRAAKALSMARALYDVVSLPPPEARHGAQAWHPGLEDLEEDEGDSPGCES
ncbi:hypothetical protein GPECTOR_44g67 [Gonium pectorale]|uniref:G domain-containing protein n=1 Tax=Gonium pectorale TaxID=33097 RepID=A0A150G990_GONPE|nr:hypothetical protein GPECTOR_44g67 [Gonium pectorale]|eukprot:KXZ46391.1 hypothetical protein GPECTOR_44g67 [Gonium pectorale]